jgi:hypothetical protein
VNKIYHKYVIEVLSCICGLFVYFRIICKFTINGTFCQFTFLYDGMLPVAQWLRHCAANRKVAISIPDGVSGIFH